MARSIQELLREASQLSENDRVELAGRLIQSLEGPPDADVEAAWAEEIERRIRDLDEGKSKRFLGSRFEPNFSATRLKEIRFHPEARRELLRAADWYLARSPTAAAGYEAEIANAMHRRRP